MDERLYHLDAQQKSAVLSAFVEVLAAERDVAFACLFGSLAERLDVHDIDVGVYLTLGALVSWEGRFWKFENPLAMKLEEAVLSVVGSVVPVDVRVANRAPLHAQYEILTGEIIHISDQDEFARVVEYAVPAYLDIKPLRDQALREVMGR
jgi:predicted nucleotidyltransferase